MAAPCGSWLWDHDFEFVRSILQRDKWLWDDDFEIARWQNTRLSAAIRSTSCIVSGGKPGKCFCGPLQFRVRLGPAIVRLSHCVTQNWFDLPLVANISYRLRLRGIRTRSSADAERLCNASYVIEYVAKSFNITRHSK